MQFLVITRQTSAPPLELSLPLMQAMEGWVAEQRASGRVKSMWAFAGAPGGGGLVEVSSHEELDELMIGFPLAPWSSIEVLAVSDLDHNLKATQAMLQRMMEMMPPR
jgi:muconolactone delta-isomerase